MNLNRMIDQVAKEKGIPRDTLVEALEAALVSAARKKYGNKVELEAQYSDETGEVEVFLFKDVVEEVEDSTVEIDLDTARRELDPEAEIGDQLGVKMETESFGRIAAQTAKQVIIQKVKDAERENIYTEYKDRKSDVVTGIVQRFEKRNIVVNLGRAEAILPFNEQIPRETYRQGDRIRALILDVRRTQKDPQIILVPIQPGLPSETVRTRSPGNRRRYSPYHVRGQGAQPKSQDRREVFRRGCRSGGRLRGNEGLESASCGAGIERREDRHYSLARRSSPFCVQCASAR